MRSGKRTFKRTLAAAALLCGGALAIRGELQIWVQHLAVGKLAPFFRTVSMPGGDIEVRRPPAETRAALSDAILKSPDVMENYSLRAHEDELALDFVAAEADWRMYARRANDYIALADYYERREQPQKEVAALEVVAGLKAGTYAAVERILTVADTEGLPAATVVTTLERWTTLHPDDQTGARHEIEYLIAHKQFDAALRAIANYERQFPQDRAYALQQRADLETARGSADKALAMYDSAFEPLWATELTGPWFGLLESQGRLREFLGATRTALQKDPADLNATARLFDYWQHQQNAVEARRALVSFQLARTGSPQATDLWTIGQLFERLPDLDEAARNYYAMYSLPGVAPTDAERSLVALASLLLDHSGDPIAFGSGDLSFYRDIAQTDRSPGFLNGILSLVLNSASPAREYRTQNEKSAAYFRRASGDRLVTLLQTRFPKSVELPALRASLVRAYAAYADNDAVIRSAREYIAAYPDGAQLVDVAMLLADSLAVEDKQAEEFGLYDMLLKRLGSRSPQYGRVLDRYLARLSEVDRPLDALRVFRTEIDRNPNDPALYRQFAQFLDHNKLATQLIETYRRAMAKFPDGSWHQELARWYLREKRVDYFRRLTREAVQVFSGSDLEAYFDQVVANAAIDDQLYLQLNLYAHQRFPEDLQFVRNLLGAYRRTDIADNGAYFDLLRRYWLFDANLRREYMQDLSARGELAKDIEQTRSANNNPAAVQFTAEAEAWRSHFEAAAPAFRAVAEATPGVQENTTRAASIYRSLAAFDPDDKNDTRVAVDLTQLAYRSNPRDRELLATEGDIYADRGELSKARPLWNAMTRVEPGKPDSYLAAATVFWDYYLFGDALRTIEAARRKFANPELYAYQEGAIYEGQRDYSAAIAQYDAGAVKGDGQAENRLLRLAKRKDVGGIVDRITAASLASPSGRRIRVAVLEAQERRDELEHFLAGMVNTAPGEVVEVARRDGFPVLEDQAMEKQATLTTDPVDRMRLQIELVHFFEGRKDVAKARETMNALYQANPRVLGVVRAAVDFEARQGRIDRAIETLQTAAAASRPGLADRFVLEAAQKASGAGEFDRARTSLAALLKADPFNAEYLAVLGETFRTDDAGFERFTLATVKALQASPLLGDQRTARIVTLRRGLIPVLTRNGQFDRAVDQYVESINRYPEDEALTREAALYAVAHGRVDQLRAFYTKTIHEASRDYRWPIVLARVETAAVDYPAAIADYDLAMKDRPDRVDLAEARATLEERTLRFDDAIRTYRKVYELTYHQASWMDKIAEFEARLGRDADAVRDVRTAIIGDRKETAPLLLQVADRLDGWNLVTQALAYADRAATVDAEKLTPDYWRIVARARKVQGTEKFGEGSREIAAVVGPVVASEYSPEERERLATVIGTSPDWLDFAKQSALFPLQAAIVAEDAKTNAQSVNELNALQTQRGVFEELGPQMERLSQAAVNDSDPSIVLGYAASAYIAAGDRANALRIFRDRDLAPNLREWYLATLSRTAPEELVTLAGKNVGGNLRNQAVQYAIANDPAELALRAVAARGRGENALWTRAFTALTGLYFLDPARAINMAFTGALGSDATVGERVQAHVDRKQQLAGNIWFYYGLRYGEYLGDLKRGDALQFLPSRLELMPGNVDAYVELGDWFENAGQVTGATQRYREALQLNPDRVDALDHLARMTARHGNKTEALVQWRAAIAALERLQSKGVAVPESFWSDATEMIADIGKAGALQQMQPELTRWLTDYAQRNSGYRFDPLLLAVFGAALDAHEPVDWVFDLAVQTTGADSFETFDADERLTEEQRIVLSRRHLDVLTKQAAGQHGDEQQRTESEIATEREQLVSTLLDYGRNAEATTEWALLDDADRRAHVVDQVRLAAAAGRIAALLEEYRKDPVQAPRFGQLEPAVQAFEKDSRHVDALTVSDFLYRRELDSQNLAPANFLGLAGVALERKQNNDAVALLQRMNLVAGEPFETFVPAADLLAKYGLRTEAAGFLKERLQAVPWDADAILRLAKLSSGAEKTQLLNRMVADVHAPYKLRTEAAELLAPSNVSSVPADSELAVLARGSVTAASARKPYRVEARVAAAQGSDALSLLREALAINPKDATLRIATVRAALDARRDNLALSLMQGTTPDLPDREKMALLHRLSEAAERVDDLPKAILYERATMNTVKTPAPDQTRLDALTAEQNRRIQNAARQPAIGTPVEQANIVRPKLLARSSTGSTK